jgi:hypothetical protein
MQALDVKSRETLRQLVKRGLLKKPLTDDGGCCNYWLESDISDYLQGLADKRDHNAQEQQPKVAA